MVLTLLVNSIEIKQIVALVLTVIGAIFILKGAEWVLVRKYIGDHLFAAGLFFFLVFILAPSITLRKESVFLDMKLLDTTFRILALCFAFATVIILQLELTSSLLNDVGTYASDDLVGLAYFSSFYLVSIAIFPIAIIAYFIAPRNIERKWKLNNVAQDSHLTNICQTISVKMGLQHPPRVCLIDSKEPVCFSFGNRMSKYTIVLGSKLKEILTESELEAVLTHELSHALHKDTIFLTWGQVYLNLAKYWLIGLIALFTVVFWFQLIPLSGNLIVIALLSAFTVIYSYVLINSLSREREGAADLRVIHTIKSEYLKSALVKIVAEFLDFPKGNRLLLYSLAKEKFRGFTGKFKKIFLSTHPQLHARLSLIDGKSNPTVISKEMVIIIGITAGFSQIYAIPPDSEVFSFAAQELSVFRMAPMFVIGILYLFYSFFQSGFGKRDPKFRRKMLASSMIAALLSNTSLSLVGLYIFSAKDFVILLLFLAGMGFGIFLLAYSLYLFIDKVAIRLFIKFAMKG